MGLLSIFGTSRRPPDGAMSRLHSQFPPDVVASQLAAAQNSTRRELLRVVLRESLQRHGIPANWVAGEVLSTTSRTGERGVHWRLHIKHWDPRLLTHAVALQNVLVRRVVTFDPMAANWLAGVSWQFALDDESQCPALPHPTSWTAAAAAAGAAEPGANAPAGDVISGPVHISRPSATRDAAAERADLNQLLAIRDADFQQHAEGAGHHWASTEPAKL